MKFQGYPGRAVLEETSSNGIIGRYEANWQECTRDWTRPVINATRASSSTTSSEASNNSCSSNNDSCNLNVDEQNVVVDNCALSTRKCNNSNGDSNSSNSSNSSSGCNSRTESASSSSSGSSYPDFEDETDTNLAKSNNFLIPRPRLIVPVHTYARKRRTGAPQALFRRPKLLHKGTFFYQFF